MHGGYDLADRAFPFDYTAQANSTTSPYRPGQGT
jgi:hypothetical protein